MLINPAQIAVFNPKCPNISFLMYIFFNIFHSCEAVRNAESMRGMKKSKG